MYVYVTVCVFVTASVYLSVCICDSVCVWGGGYVCVRASTHARVCAYVSHLTHYVMKETKKENKKHERQLRLTLPVVRSAFRAIEQVPPRQLLNYTTPT